MKHYENAINSGVKMYEETADGIILQFEAGEKYLYNFIRPGEAHVKEMITLARKGVGLATYVNQHVRDNFYSKLK